MNTTTPRYRFRYAATGTDGGPTRTEILVRIEAEDARGAGGDKRHGRRRRLSRPSSR